MVGLPLTAVSAALTTINASAAMPNVAMNTPIVPLTVIFGSAAEVYSTLAPEYVAKIRLSVAEITGFVATCPISWALRQLLSRSLRQISRELRQLPLPLRQISRPLRQRSGTLRRTSGELRQRLWSALGSSVAMCEGVAHAAHALSLAALRWRGYRSDSRYIAAFRH